uniref:transforming growth factor-beta-induced protein ig-h3-like isoform X1 n=1 Tax=Myxine glutinosa TaxID=7769 RepID=UPI00358F2CCC
MGLHTCLFVAVALSLYLCCTCTASYFDKILLHSRIRGSKHGSNVCAVQHVEGTDKKYFSNCKQWYSRQICGNPTVVSYECCPGYERVKNIEGCTAISPIVNMHETLGKVGALLTKSYSNQSELQLKLEGEGVYTMFAPSNEAWQLLPMEYRDALLNNINVELLNSLHYHMVPQRLLTGDLPSGTVLTSMYEKQPLYINHYRNGIVTVNCARLVTPNFLATNGVVHLIDRVNQPVSNTIGDIVDHYEELEQLGKLVNKAGLLDMLSADGPLTLFAPSNAAFDKLPQSTLKRIMNNTDELKALILNHVLHTMRCTESFLGPTPVHSAEGAKLTVNCDAIGHKINGNINIQRKDIVATNGVIHIIDELIVPDAVKDMVDVAETYGVNEFTKLLTRVGLRDRLSSGDTLTVLAPKNEALEELPTMPQYELKKLAEQHLVQGRYLSRDLYHGQLLESLFGTYLRVFVYHRALCIENACVDIRDKPMRNGALFILDGIIRPPTATIIDILSSDKRFSILVNWFTRSGLRKQLREPGEMTLFAPTNEALQSMAPAKLAHLRRNREELAEFLGAHLSQGALVRGGMVPVGTNLVTSTKGTPLEVKVEKDRSVTVNGQKVEETDLMATNGVIHVINGVLDMPAPSQEMQGDQPRSPAAAAILRRLVSFQGIKNHALRYSARRRVYRRRA